MGRSVGAHSAECAEVHSPTYAMFSFTAEWGISGFKGYIVLVKIHHVGMKDCNTSIGMTKI